MNLPMHEPWFRSIPRRRPAIARAGEHAKLAGWSPAVDIRETQAGFEIHTDIPGVDPKDIDITMDEGVLTIQGERKQFRSEDGESMKRTERRHGKFSRRFSLPDTADTANITAASKHGVLEISIPKLAEPQPRRVEVKH